MSFSDSLIVHAMQLLAMDHRGGKREDMRDISERRAVSAAYYALFHKINKAAVDLIAPNVPAKTNHRIQRWFEHSEMKKICGRFVKARLDQPLLDLIGERASDGLQNVARTFIKLQEARYSADYDLSDNFGSEEARQLVNEAVVAMANWDDIQGSAEANIFILSLLLWKNWDRDRVSG